MRQLAGQRQTRSQSFYRVRGQNGRWYYHWAWVEIMNNCSPTCKTSQWQNDVLNAILWQQPWGGVATCLSHPSVWQKWENWHLYSYRDESEAKLKHILWNTASGLTWTGTRTRTRTILFQLPSHDIQDWIICCITCPINQRLRTSWSWRKRDSARKHYGRASSSHLQLWESEKSSSVSQAPLMSRLIQEICNICTDMKICLQQQS